MKRRSIGQLSVSLVGLGGNNFGTDFFGRKCDQEATTRIIHAALDAGINLIDTAEEYSVDSFVGSGRSEEVIGRALGPRRNQVVIATKYSVYDVEDETIRGRARVIRAVEASLRRLGTDRIDLYQQHMPDPQTPVDELLEALTRLVEQGKVREIGCCNFSGAMLDEAVETSRKSGLASLASAQNQYNLLDEPAEEGVVEACRRHGLKLIPFFPLASGLLTGKYTIGVTPPPGSRFAVDTFCTDYLRDKQVSDDRIARVAQFDAFARERGHTILELAMSWLAAQDTVASIIAGASNVDQVVANAHAASWSLTPQDLADIEAIRGQGKDQMPASRL
ncbi:MAG TPA: aldo/keto reductase [Novosphingobium sp.]|nr:aldo/keto reductase [Novosphingobium sp.]